jgi:hypothetical protein
MRKERILDVTHSQYAVPLLDSLFDQPVFTSSHLYERSEMPSKPMVMNMLGRLKNAGILTVLREGSDRRPQILALTELINVCAGADVI